MAKYEDGTRLEKIRCSKNRSRLASLLPENVDSSVRTEKKNNDTATHTSPASDTNGLDPKSSGHDPPEAEQQRAQTVILTKAAGPAAWHYKILFVTQVLLIGSLVALLTLGSLMFGGAVIVMTTGLPFLVFTAFLLLPVCLSLSPVIMVLGSAAFLAASGLLALAGFGFYQYALISWLHDYLLDFHPPGSREVAAIRQYIRYVYVPARLLLLLTTFASAVARYLRSPRSC